MKQPAQFEAWIVQQTWTVTSHANLAMILRTRIVIYGHQLFRETKLTHRLRLIYRLAAAPDRSHNALDIRKHIFGMGFPKFGSKRVVSYHRDTLNYKTPPRIVRQRFEPCISIPSSTAYVLRRGRYRPRVSTRLFRLSL